MPAYNEATNIGLMIKALFEEEFPKIKDVEMHLLVVDDNSPDGTGDIVKKEMQKYPNLHILQGEKQGLGWAYVRGMKYSMKELKADAVIEMDADFQHDPKYVKDLVKAFVDGADYVIGSRYVKGGSIPKGWGLHRKAMSFFGNMFAKVMLWKPGLHDFTTGFRLTRVEGVLENVDLDSLMEIKRFAHKLDLFFRTTKLAKKIVEVPIDFKERTKDSSKFVFKEMVASYKVVVLIRLRESKRLIRFGIVGFAGFVVNFVFIRLFRQMGLSETLAWLFSTELAILNNFTWNNLWTFKEKQISGTKNIFSKFLTFNATSAGALVIQSIFGPLGVKMVGVQYDALVLAFVVVFMVLPYNYLMYNLVIWKTWKNPFKKKNS